MLIAAGVAAAGTIGGALLSNSAQKKANNAAAETQNAATAAQLQLGQESLALNKDIYNSNYNLGSGYVSRGNVAGDAYNALLGLPSAPAIRSPLAAAGGGSYSNPAGGLGSASPPYTQAQINAMWNDGTPGNAAQAQADLDAWNAAHQAPAPAATAPAPAPAATAPAPAAATPATTAAMAPTAATATMAPMMTTQASTLPAPAPQAATATATAPTPAAVPGFGTPVPGPYSGFVPGSRTNAQAAIGGNDLALSGYGPGTINSNNGQVAGAGGSLNPVGGGGVISSGGYTPGGSTHYSSGAGTTTTIPTGSTPGATTPPATTPPATTPPAAGTSAQDAFNNFANSAGIQFQLEQGTNALNNMYAGRGVLQSGAAEKGISDYAQQTALNNYFMPYMGLLGGQQTLGANMASSIAGVGANFGNTAAGINGQMGNAINGGAQNIGNLQLANGQNQGNMYGTIGGALGTLASSFGGSGSPSSTLPDLQY